jgi:hypothetical protein
VIRTTKFFTVSAVALLLAMSAHAQGTFIYDQQSVNSDFTRGESLTTVQTAQPIGQSFTPTLDSINFIRLYLEDRAFNGMGAAVYINLRSNSITGPILASTEPVFMPDGFAARTNFFFSNLVSVSPGTTLYLQPVVQFGDAWGIYHDRNYGYSGGTAFFAGQADLDFDLWFREGVIVPEPSSTLLLLSGAVLVLYARRTRTLSGKWVRSQTHPS